MIVECINCGRKFKPDPNKLTRRRMGPDGATRPNFLATPYHKCIALFWQSPKEYQRV